MTAALMSKVPAKNHAQRMALSAFRNGTTTAHEEDSSGIIAPSAHLTIVCHRCEVLESQFNKTRCNHFDSSPSIWRVRWASSSAWCISSQRGGWLTALRNAGALEGE